MIISFIIIAWTVVLANNDFGNNSDACILCILTGRKAPTVQRSEDENMLGNDGNILGFVIRLHLLPMTLSHLNLHILPLLNQDNTPPSPLPSQH